MINNLRFLTLDGEIDFSKIDYNGTEVSTSSIYFPKTSVGLYETKSIVPLENLIINSQNFTDENDLRKLTPTLEYPTHNLKFKILQEGNSNHFFIAYITQDESGDPVVNFLDEIYLNGTITKDIIEVDVNKEFSSNININKTIDKNGYIAKEYETKEYSLISGNLIETNSILKGQSIIIGCYSKEEKSAAGSLIISDVDESGEENIIAFINLYAEFEGEDERLKVLLNNLGYTLPEEDNFIFNETDINEELTNWILLNEKRKELLLEGHNIKPFIGTYKAVVNAIKFYGYDDLKLKEYWYDVNTNKLIADDVEYYGGTSKIKKPNKNLKKTNMFSLNYRINNPNGTFDVWDIPNVDETSNYTIDEVLVKLYGLKKRLEKTYLPANVKIIDITAEGDYFDQVNQNVWTNQHKILTVGAGKEASFNTFPKNENRKLFIEDLRHVSKRFSYKSTDSIKEFANNHLGYNIEGKNNFNNLNEDDVLYKNAEKTIPNDLVDYFKDYREFPLNNKELVEYINQEFINQDLRIVDENEETLHNYSHKFNALIGNTKKKENLIKDGRLYNKYIFGYIPNLPDIDTLFHYTFTEDNVNLFTNDEFHTEEGMMIKICQDNFYYKDKNFLDRYYEALVINQPDVSFPEFNGLYVYEQNKESFNLNTFSNLNPDKFYIFKAKMKIEGYIMGDESDNAFDYDDKNYRIRVIQSFGPGNQNKIAYFNNKNTKRYFGEDFVEIAFAFKPDTNDNMNITFDIRGNELYIKNVKIKDVELYEADYTDLEYDIKAFYDHYYDVRKSTHTNLKSTPIGCPVMSYCDSLTDEWDELRGNWNDYEDLNNTIYNNNEIQSWYTDVAGDGNNLSLNEYYIPSTTDDDNNEQVLDKFIDEYLRLHKYNTWAEYESALKIKLKANSSLYEKHLERVKKGDSLYCWNNIWKNGIVDIEWNISYIKGSNPNAPENAEWNKTFRGRIEDFHKIYYVLPYLGKYNLEMKLYDVSNVCSTVIEREHLEVHPKNVEIYGWTPWIYGKNDLESDKIDKITDVENSVASFYHSLDRNNYIHDEKNGYEFSTCYYRRNSDNEMERTTGPYFWNFLKLHTWNDGSRFTWDNTIIAGDETASFDFLIIDSDEIEANIIGDEYRIDLTIYDINGKSYRLRRGIKFENWTQFFNEVNNIDDVFWRERVNFNPVFIYEDDGTKFLNFVRVVIDDVDFKFRQRNPISLRLPAVNGTLTNIPVNRIKNGEIHNPTFDTIKIIKTHDYIKKLNHCVFSYDYGNVPGIVDNTWIIYNKTTKTSNKYSKDEYLTYLFNETGNINISLHLKDSNGNKYQVEKDILTII